jgi:YfiH family protein
LLFFHVVLLLDDAFCIIIAARRRGGVSPGGARTTFYDKKVWPQLTNDKQILAEFNTPGCSHAFFNRHGGVSQAPFFSRNVSFGVGDQDTAVRKNRELVKQALQPDRLISARQVHGDLVYHYRNESDGDDEIDGVDALITACPGTGLMIQQADCQAVLLYDPVHRAIGAVHCGWRGTVAGIIGKTVARMRECFGTEPSSLLAAVSPSLGPCCGEFTNYKTELPEALHRFQVRDSYFDFWAITRCQLQECGLAVSAIAVAGQCTVCSPDYFSYRRATRKEMGRTGRNCSVIVLHRDGGKEIPKE